MTMNKQQCRAQTSIHRRKLYSLLCLFGIYLTLCLPLTQPCRASDEFDVLMQRRLREAREAEVEKKRQEEEENKEESKSSGPALTPSVAAEDVVIAPATPKAEEPNNSTSKPAKPNTTIPKAEKKEPETKFNEADYVVPNAKHGYTEIPVYRPSVSTLLKEPLIEKFHRETYGGNPDGIIYYPKDTWITCNFLVTRKAHPQGSVYFLAHSYVFGKILFFTGPGYHIGAFFPTRQIPHYGDDKTLWRLNPAAPAHLFALAKNQNNSFALWINLTEMPDVSLLTKK